ncbi:hypothetical protein [Maricaulis maris]|uniref:hypothetical protein n=1 Tax=Maricaulis maris TaxID=74318 RepID=UPI0011C4A635|nr:hypothetical protein [Maricaulis maris]
MIDLKSLLVMSKSDWDSLSIDEQKGRIDSLQRRLIDSLSLFNSAADDFVAAHDYASKGKVISRIVRVLLYLITVSLAAYGTYEPSHLVSSGLIFFTAISGSAVVFERNVFGAQSLNRLGSGFHRIVQIRNQAYDAYNVCYVEGKVEYENYIRGVDVLTALRDVDLNLSETTSQDDWPDLPSVVQQSG